MTDLRTKSTAVQAATFPSHEFAAAVRDWVQAVTDALAPAPVEAERVDVGMQCLGCGDTERPCRCEGYSPEPATDRCWLGDSCSDCNKPAPVVPEMPVCELPAEMPQDVALAVLSLHSLKLYDAADRLRDWWRNSAQPVRGIERAREIAAQCWCDPETEMIEMDGRLAEAFAKRLVCQQAAQPAEGKGEGRG